MARKRKLPVVEEPSFRGKVGSLSERGAFHTSRAQSLHTQRNFKTSSESQVHLIDVDFPACQQGVPDWW
jgi:hypothetical protein